MSHPSLRRSSLAARLAVLLVAAAALTALATHAAALPAESSATPPRAAAGASDTRYVAFLQEEGTASEAPSPAEILAAELTSRQLRLEDIARRLPEAQNNDRLRDELASLTVESQHDIGEAAYQLAQELLAASYGGAPLHDEASNWSRMAARYVAGAESHHLIPRIISINFPYADNQPPNSSLMPAENWNVVPNAGGASDIALVDDAGNPTSATLGWIAQGHGEATPVDAGAPGDQALMRGGIRAWYNGAHLLHGPGPVRVDIQGLEQAMPAGYQVYVYIGMGISLEVPGGAPLYINVGEETPTFSCTCLPRFKGEWVRIDGRNPEGNYFLSPVYADDVLHIEMAPVAFFRNSGQEQGTAAINGIQLVGAADWTPVNAEKELERAATAARAAQQKFQQSTDQLRGTPPGDAVPRAAERSASLTLQQQRVADQIDALRAGNLSAVIESQRLLLNEQLAEVAAAVAN